MKWEDFNPAHHGVEMGLYVKTSIECPECGRYLLKDRTITTASIPPKSRYFCDCGWEGYK